MPTYVRHQNLTVYNRFFFIKKKMKLSTLLLLSTFAGSNAFYKSHDIITHDDGSVHLFEKTQHRRLTTKNLKANSDTTNTKFTVHGSEYITMNLHVDGIATVGGLEFENTDDSFGTNFLTALAGNGITVDSGKLTADTQLSDADVRSKFSAGTGITIGGAGEIATTVSDTNTQLSDADVRSKFSAGTGITIDGAGEIATTVSDTNTQLSDADVRSKFSAGTGITIDGAGEIATTVLTAAANSGLTISGSAISANVATGVIKDALDAVEAADTTTAVQKEYRLEKMILVLCNTLGLKYEHLVRAVDEGTFDPFERFSAIQVNDDDLYSTDSNSKLIDITAVSSALCNSYTNYASACASGYSNRHALAMCASGTCAASDFTASGLCCVPN